jgi:hypothetical protein
MNTVYESLRTLLRNKEQEIKKLEKEIEALRVVLPIVAEAAESGVDAGPTFESPRAAVEMGKPKMALAGPDFDSVMAQVKATQAGSATSAQARPAPIPESVPPKPRTSWP